MAATRKVVELPQWGEGVVELQSIARQGLAVTCRRQVPLRTSASRRCTLQRGRSPFGQHLPIDHLAKVPKMGRSELPSNDVAHVAVAW